VTGGARRFIERNPAMDENDLHERGLKLRIDMFGR